MLKYTSLFKRHMKNKKILINGFGVCNISKRHTYWVVKYLVCPRGICISFFPEWSLWYVWPNLPHRHTQGKGWCPWQGLPATRWYTSESYKHINHEIKTM